MSEAAIPGAAAAAQISAAPLEGFAALHREHDELRRWFAQAKAGSERDEAAEMVREFLRRAAACGATLSNSGERNAAQAVLDYWYAELVGLPEPRAGDFQRVRLAEASAEGQAAGAANVADAEPDPESRELIRLAATARLWRDSGERGFLLSGDALDRAAKFHGVDADIDRLVQASRKFLRTIWIKGIAAGIVFLVCYAASVLIFLFVLAQYLSERAIHTIKDSELHGPGTASVRSNRLWQLGLYQPLQPPFDLSYSGGGIVFDGVKVPGLKLKAPNFSGARFKSVDFHKADLQLASFSDTVITGTKNNFAGANLYRAQFLGARIEETSFAGAKLYRAIFNQACFKNVEFSKADLRAVSFWNVMFDDKFLFNRNFKDSPWWLADGWNSRQVAGLSTADQSGFDAFNVFEKYWQDIRKEARNSPTGTKRRAEFVNQLAWDLATWGRVPPASAPSPSLSLEQTCRRFTTTAVPEQAMDAADNAVCIVHGLKKSDSAGDLNDLLANLQDTRAYVLLQSGRSTEAAEIYRKEVIPFDEDGDVLFRAAVAHQAIGDGDAALAFLKRSAEKQYVPTHEMHTLKHYIDGSFQKAVYEQIDRFRPSVPPPAECR